MIQLPNGCHCGELSVNPKNWKQVGASIKKNWYITYRFYDPAFSEKYPDGKLRMVKGMNGYHRLDTRRKATIDLIEAEMHLLLNDGFNPISNNCTPITSVKSLPIKPPAHIGRVSNTLIDPNTPIIVALNFAFNKIEVESGTRLDIKSMLKYIGQAAVNLNFEQIEISQLQRKHIRFLLDEVKIIRNVFSNSRFNKYRTYLMILLEELMELEAIDGNPAKAIRKKKEIVAIKDLLTDEQRVEVNDYLYANYRNFWQLLHIFFHSGSRVIELCRVKVEDVDIKKQQCKYLLKKGRAWVEVLRPIKNSVIELWEDQIKGAKPGHYIFSVGLKPGINKISPSQITRRWKRLVKDNKKLGITADFYSLKHLNTDETAAELDLKDAAAQNSHTSTVITMKHYAFGEKERQNERLKKVTNKFA